MRKNSNAAILTATNLVPSFIAIIITILLGLDSKSLFAHFAETKFNSRASVLVQGKVWLDANENGLFENSDESGVSNVLIKLHGSARTTQNQLSDSEGNFEFSALAPGTYSLEFINPLDYRFTLANQGDDENIDSDVDPETGEILNLTVTEDGTVGPVVKVGLVKQDIQTPTPIALEKFELSPGVHEGQNGIHIEWTTTSEIDTNGFYLFRSTTGSYGDAVKISPFIPSKGGPSQTSEYDYWDTNVYSTIIYTYWLQEEIAGDGGTSENGPRHISAVWPGNGNSIPPAGSGDEDMQPIKLYLPIVKR